ncbi:MAG: Type 1 glutamine amidotransferase-like domain-containing protein [Intrasporangium sp.]|uniref:Type 1 glutamine amidotransferase-like domain-containing protein n=1 Tax=Intrasporangium sp. TaxID=1925024 RepID=UPI003F803A3F
MTTILLGPQRFTVTVTAAVRALDVDGPIAMVNAGWLEREEDDGELASLLDGRGRNLRLYHRMVDVMTKDTAFAKGALAFREQQEELRDFYGLRLQAAVDTVRAVRHRSSPHGLKSAAFASAAQAVRDVDRWYAAQLKGLYREMGRHVSVWESPVIGWHRGEIEAMLEGCAAVVIAGGHVGVLLQAFRLFSLELPEEIPVVAWSAGAMALTDRVVLFHDFTHQEVTAPEYHDRGLGRLPGIIALPHARRRLRLGDPDELALLARRFPRKQLVLLDDGTFLRFPTGDAPAPPGARVIADDGTVETVDDEGAET